MNFFALSSILTAVLTAVLGFIILFANFKSKINIWWFLVSVSVFTWTAGLAGTVLVNSKTDALLWQRILYLGTVLIPIFFFNFCIIFLEKEKLKRVTTFIGYIFSVFFIFLIPTKLFILSIGDRTDFGYWPVQTGSLYWLFLVYFIFYIAYPLFLLRKEIKKGEGVYQKQIQFIYYAALVGIVGGSTNFLLDFNLNAYPIGNFFVSLYVIFMAYAILKHHLFNIKIIATELFTLAICVALLINIINSNGYEEVITNSIIFIAVVISGFWLVRSVIKEVQQREEIAKMAEDVRRAYVIEKKAKEELENLDKVKNQFLAQTQHDLRTPLGIIRDYCDLLVGGTFGKIPKKSSDVVKRIQVVAENKIKDVNNFLDTTQFKLGKKVVSLKPGVELDPILDEIMVGLEPLAKAKSIYLKLEKPKAGLMIEADREKLKAAIFNIVDNSIKYTPTGGVTIKVQVGNTINITVSDTGIGIPKEKIATLFDTAFERSEEAKKASPTGRGIGLYLSSQIIKAHNGKVWVESEGQGKGSVFYVQLPIASK